MWSKAAEQPELRWFCELLFPRSKMDHQAQAVCQHEEEVLKVLRTMESLTSIYRLMTTGHPSSADEDCVSSGANKYIGNSRWDSCCFFPYQIILHRFKHDYQSATKLDFYVSFPLHLLSCTFNCFCQPLLLQSWVNILIKSVGSTSEPVLILLISFYCYFWRDICRDLSKLFSHCANLSPLVDYVARWPQTHSGFWQSNIFHSAG